MGSSARARVSRAPAARAAMAAAIAAVAATVLVGLGHAEEEAEAAPSEPPAALPVVASTAQAVAPATAARPRHEASGATAPTTTAPTTTTAPSASSPSEREEAPERVRIAAPRPAAEDSAGDSAAGENAVEENTAAPTATADRHPTAQPHAPAPTAQPGTGDSAALVPGTPCTATARACVALDARKAWLIDSGRVVRGPVPIQHGDEADPTPRGTFAVEWKAEQYTSREYLTQMPYSVFFAPGGIAFHQGGQDTPSAGCVKLEHDDAKAWFGYLQVGDEVQIH